MEPHSDSGASSPRHSPSSSVSDSEFSTSSTESSTLFTSSVENLRPSEGHYIAIVGGLGYIGSHTCLELLKEGYNIIIIDNLSNSYRKVYDRLGTLVAAHYEKRCEPQPEMRLYVADYRDKMAITKILEEYVCTPIPSRFSGEDTRSASKIQGVINFGAYKSVSESIADPLKYYANNVAGLIEFCSILNSFSIKTFIFSSSATVYGSLANSGKPLLEEYCTHQMESFADHDGQIKTVDGGCTGLTNPYGRTKWMCEAILSDLALADPVCILSLLPPQCRMFRSLRWDNPNRLNQLTIGILPDLDSP